MRLRTGKTIASGVTTPTPPKFNPMAELKKITHSKTITVDTAQNMYKEQTPKTSIAVLHGLINSVRPSCKIEKMKKISLIYDIILADKTLLKIESCRRFIDVVCESIHVI